MGLNVDDSTIVTKLTEMAESLAGINATLKSVDDRIDRIEERVAAIEQKPGKIVDLIVAAVISAVVALLFKL